MQETITDKPSETPNSGDEDGPALSQHDKLAFSSPSEKVNLAETTTEPLCVVVAQPKDSNQVAVLAKYASKLRQGNRDRNSFNSASQHATVLQFPHVSRSGGHVRLA
jgi:hypothetical protein